jgi:hypothetical protein
LLSFEVKEHITYTDTHKRRRRRRRRNEGV